MKKYKLLGLALLFGLLLTIIRNNDTYAKDGSYYVPSVTIHIEKTNVGKEGVRRDAGFEISNIGSRYTSMCLKNLSSMINSSAPGSIGNMDKTYFMISFTTNGMPEAFGSNLASSINNGTGAVNTYYHSVHEVAVSPIMRDSNSGDFGWWNSVVITGEVWGNGTSMCFPGDNFEYVEGGMFFIGYPTVNFYNSWEAMNYEYTRLIYEKLNSGLTVNIDKSGLATSNGQTLIQQGINNLTNQQKEQFETEQQQREDDHNEAQGAQDEAKEVGTGEDETNQATENAANLFTTILNTPAGSCSIGPLNMYGFNMGSLNLCVYKPPEWLKTVMGAVVTIVMAGASIKAISRLLDIVSSGLL